MVSQISANKQIHDQVQLLSVLEGVGHVDEERMLELRQEFSLVQD